MSSSFGNIGDLLGNLGDASHEIELKCKIRGCNNTVYISGDTAMQSKVPGNKARLERMCDACYEKFQTLTDKEMPCSKPGCEGTWIWNRYQQLEALVAGRTSQPKGLCAKCQEEVKNVQSIQVPCRMKGCKNTWTLTAREQVELAGKPAPHKLCNECFKILETLQDKELTCRIAGCGHTFIWNRFQQLEHIRAGKSIDNPPAKMCDECFNIFKNLKPQEIKCRIKGCEHTWTYSTYEQLENIIKARKAASAAEPAGTENAPAQGTELPVPPPPERMCKECFEFFRNAQDIQVKCRNHYCNNTWTYSKGMQLNQKQHDRTAPPSRYCDECTKRLQTLEDKAMPCMQKGCSGTWNYTKEEQLKDATANRPPKPRRCQQCNEFLTTHPAEEIACSQCGKPIKMTSYELLDCQLGVSKRPELCSDCSRAKMTEELATDNTASVINRPLIVIPKTGAWSEDSIIQSLPAGITQEKIDQFIQATRRLVCLGDEMILSCEGKGGWPILLEECLNERLGGGVAVLNAGISGCTTEMALKRFERDVTPFKPQVVLFSTLFADVMASQNSVSDEEMAEMSIQMSSRVKQLCDKIRSLSAAPVAFIPNPVAFKEDSGLDKETAEKRQRTYDAASRHYRKACEDAGVKTIVDAQAMYQLMGSSVSSSWKQNWYLHNEQGAENIANWAKDELIGAALLEKESKIN